MMAAQPSVLPESAVSMKVCWAPIGVMPWRHEARTYEPSERMR